MEGLPQITDAPTEMDQGGAFKEHPSPQVKLGESFDPRSWKVVQTLEGDALILRGSVSRQRDADHPYQEEET